MSREAEDPLEEASLESFPARDPSHRTIDRASGSGELQRRSAESVATGVWASGIITGLIGYAVVALFFAAASMLGGRSPFHIAALLGDAIFSGRQAGDAGVQAASVLAFNGIHLVVSIMAGIFMAALATVAERAVQGWYLGLSLLLYVGAHVVVVPVWFDEQVRLHVSLGIVTIATTVAALAMGAYLWKLHPGLRAGMHEPDE